MLPLIFTLIALISAPADDPTAAGPVAATVRSSMESDAPHIRQLALDGDEDTSFMSKDAAKPEDQFTLTLDRPVSLKSIRVLTGTKEGSKGLEGGMLEVSGDGKTFDQVATLSGPETTAQGDDRKITAVRIKPKADAKEQSEIREIVLDSTPPVARFTAPVEYVVDVTDAPEMADWIEKVVKVCERAYPMMCEELKSDGFQPPNLIRIRLENDYDGVAAASGTRIVGSVRFFKAHPDDLGAFVHETAHVVQHYRGRGNPGWLVEGVADYIRFFKHEPENIGRIDPKRSHYNSSYRVSASFLNFLNETYDKSIVHDLNTMMREGRYDESFFKERTGKTLPELDEQWRATLKD